MDYVDGKIVKDIYNIDIKIPSIQRLEYQNKIKEITDYQENYFKKHKRFNFLGVILTNGSVKISGVAGGFAAK